MTQICDSESFDALQAAIKERFSRGPGRRSSIADQEVFAHVQFWYLYLPELRGLARLTVPLGQAFRAALLQWIAERELEAVHGEVYLRVPRWDTWERIQHLDWLRRQIQQS